MRLAGMPPEEVNILIVEDDRSLARLVESELIGEGYQVRCAYDASEAYRLLENEVPHLVLLDLALPPSMATTEGIGIFETIMDQFLHTKVVIITGEADMDNAIDCFKKGASDFIEKPIKINSIGIIVERVLRQRALEVMLETQQKSRVVKTRLRNLIGASIAIQEVYEKITKATRSDENVLLIGETGTGKNLVARTIHEMSQRNQNKYLEINCAAIPENLMESELFGHVRGAFSGASADKKGLFEVAEKGTCLLDEIGMLSPPLQAKLLQVLDTGEIRRVGATKSSKVDVRIIAATNIDIYKSLETGKFRDDLYFRLNSSEIFLPALRERKEDIPLLADYFFEQYNKGEFMWMADECYDLLADYHWPGNVRELRNVIKSSMSGVASNTKIISPELLGKEFTSKDMPVSEQMSLKEKIDRYESQLVFDALSQFDGKIEKTARYLGLTRQGLRKKLLKFKPFSPSSRK